MHDAVVFSEGWLILSALWACDIPDPQFHQLVFTSLNDWHFLQNEVQCVIQSYNLDAHLRMYIHCWPLESTKSSCWCDSYATLVAVPLERFLGDAHTVFCYCLYYCISMPVTPMSSSSFLWCTFILFVSHTQQPFLCVFLTRMLWSLHVYIHMYSFVQTGEYFCGTEFHHSNNM